MDSIFQATKTTGGYSWTIASKLGSILFAAEQKYGPRDHSYTILGVELCGERPQIWFPGNRKQIVIQISQNCIQDINRAVFQTAHEVIHCLSPIQKDKVSVLEEGLANLFSIEFAEENQHGNYWKSDIQEYTDASELVSALLKFNKDIIKNLRKIQPSLSLIDKNLIVTTYPEIPLALAEKLTRKF